MIWRRTLLLSMLTLTGLLVQTAALGQATLVGTKPELLLLVTVALAMGEGPGLGCAFGFVAGLATDMTLGLPTGITAMTFTIVGFGVGTIRAQVQSPTAWLPIAMVFAATLGGVLLYGIISAVLGQDEIVGPGLVRHGALAACYNALLTPFVYPCVRMLGARLRPARVLR